MMQFPSKNQKINKSPSRTSPQVKKSLFPSNWSLHTLDGSQKSGVHSPVDMVNIPIIYMLFVHPNGGWPCDF